jgi:hypothetical protein
MSNLNIKINLLKLEKCIITNIKGQFSTQRCLCIPIDLNDLYTTEKAVYLDLTAWESSNLKEGKTHLLKKQYSKEKSETMTKEEKENIPIMGDAKPFTITHTEPTTTIDLSQQSTEDMPF